MGSQRVLVAFASQTGSTAAIAAVIAEELRATGLAVDCRAAGDVVDVAPYAAVILGSGVFVRRRRSDGGGFLARHEAPLATRPVWLFSAGPIGRGSRPSGTAASAPDDCSVVAVARAVGARGAAIFGPIGLPADSDPMDRLGPVNLGRVRAWAVEIAGELAAPPATVSAARSHAHRGRPLVAAG